MEMMVKKYSVNLDKHIDELINIELKDNWDVFGWTYPSKAR